MVIMKKRRQVGLRLIEKTDRDPPTLTVFLYQNTLVVTLDVVPSEISCYLGNHESVKTIALGSRSLVWLRIKRGGEVMN